PFLPHPDYFWLTGLRRAHGVVAYSKSEGWEDFVEHTTLMEKLWEGGREHLSGKDIAELEPWLLAKSFSKVYVLGQPTTKQRRLGAVLEEADFFALQESVNRVRRKKDSEEVELVLKASQMAGR